MLIKANIASKPQFESQLGDSSQNVDWSSPHKGCNCQPRNDPRGGEGLDLVGYGGEIGRNELASKQAYLADRQKRVRPHIGVQFLREKARISGVEH